MSDLADPPLRIMHVLRAPLGGLYRHVLDLSREQARRGHAVGLIADSTTGGEAADRSLATLAPHLALGLSRVPMRRDPHPGDGPALLHVIRRLAATRPDVVHGHGSKGGVYARLPAFLPGGGGAVRAYTPHGGSLNHAPGTRAHRVYMAVEKVLGRRTDLLLFESGYIGERYRAAVGEPCRLARVVRNGISRAEFEPVEPAPDAADVVYVGELRAAKGIDVLIEALALVKRRRGRVPRAVLVGSGPDRDALESLADTHGIGEAVAFTGPLPARDAFTRGRLLVMPSRAESLPYVALEAAGARVPLVATDVGGIPEIFGPYRDRLVPSGNVEALADALLRMLDASPEERARQAEDLARYVRTGFLIDSMVSDVLSAYRAALALRRTPAAAARRSTFVPSP